MAREPLAFCRSKQIDLELYGQNDVTWFDECSRGPAGGVIGHGGLDAGVDESVLLEVPGFHVELRLTGPRADRDEANAKARHERGSVEYSIQLLAWQLMKLFHIFGAFLQVTGSRSRSCAPSTALSRGGARNDCTTRLEQPVRSRVGALVARPGPDRDVVADRVESRICKSLPSSCLRAKLRLAGKGCRRRTAVRQMVNDVGRIGNRKISVHADRHLSSERAEWAVV